MKKDFKRVSVSSHDDKIRDTTVKSLGGLVGTLLELLVVGGLLNKVEDCDSQIRISQGVSLGVNFTHFLLGVKNGEDKMSQLVSLTYRRITGSCFVSLLSCALSERET
jgi:hypothetical protein